jgi:hypothetical protein
MLDAFAVVFIVVHHVVHLALILMEPDCTVVGLADVPKRIDRTARINGHLADPALLAGLGHLLEVGPFD